MMQQETTQLPDLLAFSPRGKPPKISESVGPSLKSLLGRGARDSDVFPTGHSLTNTPLSKGPASAEFKSWQLMRAYKVKHARGHINPQDAYTAPRTVAQQVGWHVVAAEGAELNYLASPRVERAKYPRSTCNMTRHMDNMFLTSAHSIARK